RSQGAPALNLEAIADLCHTGAHVLPPIHGDEAILADTHAAEDAARRRLEAGLAKYGVSAGEQCCCDGLAAQGFNRNTIERDPDALAFCNESMTGQPNGAGGWICHDDLSNAPFAGRRPAGGRPAGRRECDYA